MHFSLPSRYGVWVVISTFKILSQWYNDAPGKSSHMTDKASYDHQEYGWCMFGDPNHYQYNLKLHDGGGGGDDPRDT